MLSIIIFIVILLILVLVHEAGHFIVAKLSGMRVDEFAFGFPPRIFSWKKGETTYSLNSIPLGGYVKIYGEDGTDVANTKESRSFSSRPWYLQILTLLAGVTMNMLLAVVLFTALFAFGTRATVGENVSEYVSNTEITFTQVFPNSPAEIAGIKPGFVVHTVSGAPLPLTGAGIIQTVTTNKKVVIYGNNVGADLQTYTITPVVGFGSGSQGIGVEIETTGTVKLPLGKAIVAGTKHTGQVANALFSGTYHLIGQAFTGHVDTTQVSGPLGIAKGVMTMRKEGTFDFLGFTALLSIALAVMNTLPFPALDGGRVVMVVIEVIRRKKIPTIIQAWVNGIGFLILILLMVLITIKDILH